MEETLVHVENLEELEYPEILQILEEIPTKVKLMRVKVNINEVRIVKLLNHFKIGNPKN